MDLSPGFELAILLGAVVALLGAFWALRKIVGLV